MSKRSFHWKIFICFRRFLFKKRVIFFSDRVAFIYSYSAIFSKFDVITGPERNDELDALGKPFLKFDRYGTPPIIICKSCFPQNINKNACMCAINILREYFFLVLCLYVTEHLTFNHKQL